MDRLQKKQPQPALHSFASNDLFTSHYSQETNLLVGLKAEARTAFENATPADLCWIEGQGSIIATTTAGREYAWLLSESSVQLHRALSHLQ